MTKTRRDRRSLTLGQRIKVATVLSDMADDDRNVHITGWKELTAEVAHRLGIDVDELPESSVRTIAVDPLIDVTVIVKRVAPNKSVSRVDFDKLREAHDNLSGQVVRLTKLVADLMAWHQRMEGPQPPKADAQRTIKSFKDLNSQ